jgi:hypothetical protein
MVDVELLLEVVVSAEALGPGTGLARAGAARTTPRRAVAPRAAAVRREDVVCDMGIVLLR